MILKTFILLGLLSGAQAIASDTYDPYLSLMDFKLEETNLYKIQEKLGNSSIQQSMAMNGPRYTICYFLNKNNATIFFESGVMGGKQHQLLAYTVKTGIEKADECIPLLSSENNIHLGELGLGKEINVVKRLLPQPVEEISGYGYLHKHFYRIPFSKEDIERSGVKDMANAFWSVSIFIEIFESQGKVTGYKVSKQTSW